MARTYAQTRRAASRTKSCSDLPERISEVIREIWPVKTVANLMAEAGISERTAKYLKQGHVFPSGPTLVALLRSRDGDRILKGLMRNEEPEWLARYERALRVVEIERRLDALVAEIEDLAERRGL